MIAEGREIAKIHPNMVVKIPMTVEGLKAVKVLTAEGIKTNVTLIFTANQALLAARAECALAGADIATVPYKVIEQMTHHPLTDAGIEKFKKDYIAVFGE